MTDIPQPGRPVRGSSTISSSVLNDRLTELRAAGIIEATDEGYRLTGEGRELLAPYPALDAWAERWAARARRQVSCVISVSIYSAGKGAARDGVGPGGKPPRDQGGEFTISHLRARRAAVMAAGCACVFLMASAAAAQAAPFIGPFKPNPPAIATTVPANGDENPYGIVTVPTSVGALHRGNLLISNFNNSMNQQGTGTTIVQIPPGGNDVNGQASVFAQIDPKTLPGQCFGGVGLTTALAVTRTGFVIVGSLPTSDGTSSTAKAGCLLVLNSHGQVLETIAGGPINGPWDMTAVDHGAFTTLYVTNVLNGTLAAGTDPTTGLGNVVDRGTVVRIQLLTIPGIRPFVLDEDVIATGFPERTDPNALVIGPTGVALGADGTLYVADTQGNRIAAIPDAPFRESPAQNGGQTVSSGVDLNGPLGMTLAPNGDILTANGGDGNVVETTPSGAQTDIAADGPGGGGVLFGLTVPPRFDGIYFVDDGDNTLRVLAP